MTEPTELWWTLLRAVAVGNLLAWGVVAWLLRRQAEADPARGAARRMMLWLALGYAGGCAWRSFFPVYDVPRLVMVDSWLSSALVGRTVATLAELCFAAQWALLVGEAARVASSRAARRAAAALVPLIVVAELCSWHAVLSTSNLGHVIEESLWGLCAVLVAGSLYALRHRLAAAHAPLLWAWIGAAAVYALYMFAVDVPMYLSRWLADEAAGRPTLGLLQGAIDAATRWEVSRRWDDWHTEVVWMSLYFSAGVWFSIGLAQAPRLRPAVAGRGRPRRAAGTHPALQTTGTRQ